MLCQVVQDLRGAHLHEVVAALHHAQDLLRVDLEQGRRLGVRADEAQHLERGPLRDLVHGAEALEQQGDVLDVRELLLVLRVVREEDEGVEAAAELLGVVHDEVLLDEVLELQQHVHGPNLRPDGLYCRELANALGRQQADLVVVALDVQEGGEERHAAGVDYDGAHLLHLRDVADGVERQELQAHLGELPEPAHHGAQARLGPPELVLLGGRQALDGRHGEEPRPLVRRRREVEERREHLRVHELHLDDVVLCEVGEELREGLAEGHGVHAEHHRVRLLQPAELHEQVLVRLAREQVRQGRSRRAQELHVPLRPLEAALLHARRERAVVRVRRAGQDVAVGGHAGHGEVRQAHGEARELLAARAADWDKRAARRPGAAGLPADGRGGRAREEEALAGGGLLLDGRGALGEHELEERVQGAHLAHDFLVSLRLRERVEPLDSVPLHLDVRAPARVLDERQHHLALYRAAHHLGVAAARLRHAPAAPHGVTRERCRPPGGT
mmetsp:Transcript_5190/g.18138  ORF Transcript_5190/g.18138 Transcript_5190/m.18138 type:complete len:500 (+) Transcript_5190:570-2069(+)